MHIKPEDIGFVDIFPSIAVARVGDSDEWYIGPEIPGHEPFPPEGVFKDKHFKIKKQAARYRVYAFDKNGKVIGEIDGKHDYKLKWTVQVANKKSAWVVFRGQYEKETWELRNSTVQGWPDEKRDYAFTDTRKKLIIDSGLQTVEGPSSHTIPLQGEFYGSKPTPTKVQMGDIHTDEHGRLIINASDGFSTSVDFPGPPEQQPFMKGEFDNDDWIDSMCDGHVRVSVVSKASPT